MTWPTDRPGYPRDAERDGWHWLMIGPGIGHPFPMLWCADGEMWEAGDDGYVDAADISTRWNYLGPCYTQADLDAAVQAERVRLIGSCRAEMCRVRSMDHGPTSALDAAVAKARDQGRIEGATVGAHDLAMARKDGAREAREQIAQAFDDNDMSATAAEIRTLPISAAGEEGK